MNMIEPWSAEPSPARSTADRLSGWLTESVPLGRLAAFRTLCYFFVAADLVVFTPWVRTHAAIPGELYQPLLVGRLLPLPVPGPGLVHPIFWLLIATSLAAATGRAPRLLGWGVFALYFEWMVIAMSYGKVDHDRFAFLVALAVLPTVGRARFGDQTRSQAAGWALRVTQIAAICTYFLAAWAKIRFGGWGWATGSVLARAILRRGTDLADVIASIPHALVAAQIGILAFEFASPLVLLARGRWRYLGVGCCYAFHVMTFALVTISFLPQLVALASFLPLERVRPVQRALSRYRTGRRGGTYRSAAERPRGSWQRASRGATGHPVAMAGDPPIQRPGQSEHRTGAEDPPG